MIKQNVTECVQPVLHYYPACALNASRRRRDDSIDLMKVLFIFSQILSPVITKALRYYGQHILNLLSVEVESLLASRACGVVLACSLSGISYQSLRKTCSLNTYLECQINVSCGLIDSRFQKLYSSQREFFFWYLKSIIKFKTNISHVILVREFVFYNFSQCSALLVCILVKSCEIYDH